MMAKSTSRHSYMPGYAALCRHLGAEGRVSPVVFFRCAREVENRNEERAMLLEHLPAGPGRALGPCGTIRNHEVFGWFEPSTSTISSQLAGSLWIECSR